MVIVLTLRSVKAARIMTIIAGTIDAVGLQ